MELEAAVAQLVEAPHSKCGARKRMWVRVPPAASMHPPETVARVRELARGGLNHSEIARLAGVSQPTVRRWITTRRELTGCRTCGHEHRFDRLPARRYAYLLGIYLGDGTICRMRRGVWDLRIFQDVRYPLIIDEIATAIAAVMPKNKVRAIPKGGYVQISSYSKAWPCLFPQAGPGMKHTRKIELTAWQWAYVWQEPGMLVRGLIHSDGCRVSNKVWHGKYAYPRYFFSNESQDIQQLFRDGCDLIGVEYRNNRANSISVARRDSVAKLDAIVGPKR
jgi:hypothetical protein